METKKSLRSKIAELEDTVKQLTERAYLLQETLNSPLKYYLKPRGLLREGVDRTSLAEGVVKARSGEEVCVLASTMDLAELYWKDLLDLIINVQSGQGVTIKKFVVMFQSGGRLTIRLGHDSMRGLNLDMIIYNP